MFASTETIVLFIIVFLSSALSLIKHKLTLAGTLTALIIGLCVSLAGYEYLIIMLMFFVSSNIATDYNQAIKKQLITNYLQDKQRSSFQVFAKGFFPTLISLFIFILYNGKLDLTTDNVTRRMLQSMYIGFYCSANADTWASEYGICSKGDTYLITSFNRVPKGINGGITVFGTTMSGLGGGFIYLVAIICNSFRYGLELGLLEIIKYLIIGIILGLIGSGIDSVLGATCQVSCYDLKLKAIVDNDSNSNRDNLLVYGNDYLNNSQINLITGIITSIIAMLISFL